MPAIFGAGVQITARVGFGGGIICQLENQALLQRETHELCGELGKRERGFAYACEPEVRACAASLGIHRDLCGSSNDREITVTDAQLRNCRADATSVPEWPFNLLQAFIRA